MKKSNLCKGYSGPLKKDWLRFGKDDTNRGYCESTIFNYLNASKIEILDKTSPFITAEGGAVWVGITSDEDYVYVTTHNVAELNGGGYIFRAHKDTLEIDWKVTFESLTGVPGDHARAAPTISGNRIYVASSVFFPQTWEPYTDVVRRYRPGPVPFPTYGKRRSMICLNKETGLKLWETPLGELANTISDDDNYLVITQEPVVFHADLIGNGSSTEIVAVGSSSTQSFIPWLACDNNNPFGPSIYTSAKNIRMTDAGKLFFLDALTGILIKTTRILPEFYNTGDVLLSSSLIPGELVLTGPHWINPGELNPIPTKYGGLQNITWLLANGANIPTPLNNLTVMDNTGTPVVLAGGIPAGANLHNVTVNIDAVFNAGTTNFSVGAANYLTIDAATQLDGTGGMESARILVRLSPGDILTEEEARVVANYYGASIWGSSPTIKNVKGVALEMYITSGQNHGLPVDEANYINETTSPLLSMLNNIAAAQATYQDNPSQANLDAIRAAYATDLALLNSQLAVSVSSRGEANLKDSLISIDLRPDNFGEIIDNIKSLKYDVWNLGMSIEASRFNGAIDIPGITDIQQYFTYYRGYDGDFGEGPQYFPCGSPNGLDMIVIPSKGGLILSVEISDQTLGPSTFTLLDKQIIGNPGILGGSNFGSTSNSKATYSVQVNGGETGNFNRSYQTGDKGSNNPQAQNFFPILDWYPISQNYPNIEVFPLYRSYVNKFDLTTKSITWEVPATPQNVSAPWITSLGAMSCTDQFVIYPDGSGRIQFISAHTGTLLNSIDIQTGGCTAPIIEKQFIYVMSGRAFFSDSYPNSNYANAQFLYKMGILK